MTFMLTRNQRFAFWAKIQCKNGTCRLAFISFHSIRFDIFQSNSVSHGIHKQTHLIAYHFFLFLNNCLIYRVQNGDKKLLVENNFNRKISIEQIHSVDKIARLPKYNEYFCFYFLVTILCTWIRHVFSSIRPNLFWHTHRDIHI